MSSAAKLLESVRGMVPQCSASDLRETPGPLSSRGGKSRRDGENENGGELQEMHGFMLNE